MEIPIQYDMVAKSEADDHGKYIIGISATDDIDLHNEKFSRKALEDMANARVRSDGSKIPLNVVGRDGKHYDEITSHIGDLVESKLVDGTLVTKFKVDEDDPQAVAYWGKLNKGMNAKLSVGGKVLSSRKNPMPGVNKIYDSVTFEEVTLIKSNAANPKTIAYAFQKTLEAINAIEDDPTMETQVTTKVEAPSVKAEEIAKTEVDPVKDFLTSFEGLKALFDGSVQKVGKKFSSDTLDKLKALQTALAEIIGDEAAEEKAEGDVGKTLATEPAKDDKPEEVTKTIVLSDEQFQKAIDTAVAHAVGFAKADRKSVVDVVEKTEAPADRYAKALNYADLKAIFAQEDNATTV